MNRLLKLALILALCIPAFASAQWRQGGGGFVYTGVLAGIPASCTVGQLSFVTNATAGQQIYMCSASNTWTQQLNSGAGGASTALDNLASVNINLALTPQANVDLGSTTKHFREVFLFGTGTYGTNYHKITGASSSGARVITLPDATGTVALTSATSLPSLATVGTITSGVWNGTLIGSTYGGTANAFVAISGPASTIKTYTLPNANAVILTDAAAVTTAQGGTGLGAQSDDTMLISNGTIWQAKAIPDCQDTSTNHLNYVASTNSIVCGTAGGAGSGDVSAAAAFANDNRLIRSDGTAKGVQASGITIDDSNNTSGVANLELTNGSYLGTAHSAGNTIRIGAWDVDGAAFTAFLTCTANNTPTCDLGSAVTLGGGPIAQFTDPNLDALLYWRDSDGTIQPVTIGTGLSLSSGTLSNTGLTTAAIDTSAELKAILTDETGSNLAVFSDDATLARPVITGKVNLPSVTAFPGTPSTGDVVVVTDDSVVGACDSAAGSAISVCRWNGSAWLKLGDGTAAGGTLTSADIDTSAELRAILGDESGTGAAIFGGGNIGAGSATTAAANNNSTLIATTAYVQTELTDYAADTVTFTNKTLDCAATGNVCKNKNYIHLKRPHLCDGTGATIGTTATTFAYGTATYSNSADQLVNYCEYAFEVPADLDTSVDPRLKVKFQLGNTDTGTHRYVASSVSVADSAVLTSASLANAINLDFAGDGSGANGDMETVGYTTATSWGAALTAGATWRIRLARDGDATQDGSTVNSTVIDFVIEYGVTQ